MTAESSSSSSSVRDAQFRAISGISSSINGRNNISAISHKRGRISSSTANSPISIHIINGRSRSNSIAPHNSHPYIIMGVNSLITNSKTSATSRRISRASSNISSSGSNISNSGSSSIKGHLNSVPSSAPIRFPRTNNSHSSIYTTSHNNSPNSRSLRPSSNSNNRCRNIRANSSISAATATTSASESKGETSLSRQSGYARPALKPRLDNSNHNSNTVSNHVNINNIRATTLTTSTSHQTLAIAQIAALLNSTTNRRTPPL